MCCFGCRARGSISHYVVCDVFFDTVARALPLAVQCPLSAPVADLNSEWVSQLYAMYCDFNSIKHKHVELWGSRGVRAKAASYAEALATNL